MLPTAERRRHRNVAEKGRLSHACAPRLACSDRFSDADVYRVRFVWASDRGSPRTYAEVADEVGVSLGFVLAFEEASAGLDPGCTCRPERYLARHK
jgi:hypothetical protein